MAILERSGAASAATSAADLSVHQRPGGRVRAWVLGHDGSAFAMDEAAIARGVRGAEAHLLGDDVSGLTSTSEAHLQLQVRTEGGPCALSLEASLQRCFLLSNF